MTMILFIYLFLNLSNYSMGHLVESWSRTLSFPPVRPPNWLSSEIFGWTIERPVYSHAEFSPPNVTSCPRFARSANWRIRKQLLECDPTRVLNGQSIQQVWHLIRNTHWPGPFATVAVPDECRKSEAAHYRLGKKKFKKRHVWWRNPTQSSTEGSVVGVGKFWWPAFHF